MFSQNAFEKRLFFGRCAVNKKSNLNNETNIEKNSTISKTPKRFQLLANASEWIRKPRKARENLKKLAKTLKNFAKTSKNFTKNFTKTSFAA